LHIDTIFIIPDQKGKGCGLKIVKLSKKICKERKMRQINLYTFPDKELIKFYKRLGFEKIGILDGIYELFNEKLIFSSV